MNERTDLDRVLGTWLEAEAALTAPDDLLGPVFAVTSTSRPLPTGLALLTVPPMRTQSRVLVGSPTLRLARVFAVALLLALLAILATLAGGSGLLRPETDGLAVSRVGCGAEMPDGQLVELSVYEDGTVEGEWGPIAGVVIRMYDDGLLLMSGHGVTSAAIQAGDSGLTSRRLSRTGMRLMLEAADRDWRGTGCHDGWAHIPGGVLTVRRADGAAERVTWGRSSNAIRIMTPEETKAAGLFVDRMRNPQGWLPAEAWIDATERPYVPDRWLVNVQLPDLTGLADPEGASERRLSLPNAEDVVLPGGPGLLDLGDPYREPDGAAAPGQPGLHGRCEVVVAEEASRMTETFAAAGATVFNGSWWFRYGSDDGWSSAADLVAVQIRPLLPTDDGCSARMLGLAEPPAPSPRPQPSGDLATVEPCGILSEGSVRAAIAVPASRPIVISEDTGEGELQRIGANSRICRYRLGGSWGDPSVIVHLRTSRTEVAEARVLARRILGDAAIEEAVADRSVWRNDCALSPPECVPALVVSAESYFVAMTFERQWGGGPWGGDMRSIALALTAAIRTDR